MLYKEGEEAVDFYMVMDGELKILKYAEIPHDENWNADPTMEAYLQKNNNKRNVEMAVVRKGEIVGLEDVMYDRKRTTTVICVSPAKVFKITNVVKNI
jgi:CRP-like cAMP-binding protein